MELRSAVSHRRTKPLTPLVAEHWESSLSATSLLEKYPFVPTFIRNGAYAGIPQIHHTFTPPNKKSTEELSIAFNDIIQVEFNKGRYLGPFSREVLEAEIGPFQSSPLSLVPKQGKPGKFRLIQNLSYPHNNHPTPSINSQACSDDFPCTWGTFQTMCTLIKNLPPGTQAATRDIAEAYRIIPLHESQWPGVVVRISNNPALFALNTSNSFGGTTAGGLFGMFSDALADLMRAEGIGPILKWVDDFVFFRIPLMHISEYNRIRESIRDLIINNGGRHQTGGRIWFKGEILADAGVEQFAEDFTFPIRSHHPQTLENMFPYDFEVINKITNPLGIPWEMTKDTEFSSIVIFAGLEWNLETKRVSLPDTKRGKYLKAILEWNERTTHTLEDVQRLYGKLLWACHIVPRGRAYLTNLEKMMGTLNGRPFIPHHPPKRLAEDLTWWNNLFSQSSPSREIPGNREIIDIQGFSDASSAVGIGIVIGDKWRAWQLLPGWQAAGRDIGWAEAVGMELLLRTVLQHNKIKGLKVFGDNTGVVEGWWAGRSRNVETNRVFKRIHDYLEEHDTVLTTRYVNTSRNPADGPSRGIFPPEHLLLPPISIPEELRTFIVDFNAPLHPRERNATERFPAIPKETRTNTESHRRHRANACADERTDEEIQTPPSI